MLELFADMADATRLLRPLRRVFGMVCSVSSIGGKVYFFPSLYKMHPM
jgi:hypothetical protein